MDALISTFRVVEEWERPGSYSISIGHVVGISPISTTIAFFLPSNHPHLLFRVFSAIGRIFTDPILGCRILPMIMVVD